MSQSQKRKLVRLMADGSLIFDTKLDTSHFKSGLKSLGGMTSNAVSTITKASAAAITAGTGAVTAGVGAAIKVGSNFEASMSQVAATMGITTQEIANGSKDFEKLKAAAKDAGANTMFSASQAAEALNYMALAGYTADEAIATMPTVLNLAAAGGMELSTASDMVTDSMSALGDKAGTVESFVDKMAKTSQKSNTSVEQLGQAILTVGGTAKSLSGGVDEMNTELGILADSGIKGAEGGTLLRNVILALSAPTDVAAKKMKSLGLEVFDSEGKMRPLNETFNDLNSILSTMTEGEQTKVLSTIFNSADLKGVNALLANSGERFDELSGYISDCEGAAAAMAETMSDNLQGKITLIKSALEGLGIQIYEGLQEPLKDLAVLGNDYIGMLAQGMTDGGVDGLIDALGTVLGDLVSRAAEMAPHMVELAVRLVHSLTTGLLENVPVIMDGLSRLLVEAVNGITDIALDFSILRIRLLESFVKSLGEIIPKILPKVAEGIAAMAQALSQSLPELIPSVVEAVVLFAETLVENIPLLVDAALQLVTGLADGIVKALPVLTEALPQLITTIIDALAEAMPKIPEFAVNIMIALIDGLITAIPLLIEATPQIIAAIVNGLINGIPQILEAAGQLILRLVEKFLELKDALFGKMGEIVDGIKEKFFTLKESLAEKIGEIVEGIAEWFSELPDRIGEIIDNIVQWFSELPERIAYHLGYTVTKTILWAVEMRARAIEAGKNFIDGVITFIKELPGRVWNWLITTIAKAAAFVVTMRLKAKEAGKQFIDGVIEFIKNLPSRVWKWLTDTIAKTIAFVKDMKEKAKEAGKNFYDSIVGEVQKIPGKMGEIAANIIAGLVNGIKNGISTVKNVITNLAQSAIDGAKAALGIHSPSKKFRWIGEMCVEGMDQPIESYNPYATLSKSMQMGKGVMRMEYDASTANTRKDMFIDYAMMGKEMLRAFKSAGLTVKIGSREMGRIVSDAMA